MRFGEKVRDLRKKHSLTQDELAKCLGVSKRTVIGWERDGRYAAQIATAKRIHINLVLVKLLELHHLGYDLRHYHAQHHAFIKNLNLPAHFQFDVAAG